MDSKARPPKPGPSLYSNLFEHQDSGRSLETIEQGISAIIDNAARLLSDVDLLVSQGRFSSGRFLLTTAKEELGKAFISLDMCRLDFGKHESVLRRLAEAFYVHEAKQAYFNTLAFGGFASMDHVRRFWEAEIVRWWPSGDPESGVPDMPHATHFDRELPLYVDFSDYNGDWTLPSNQVDALHFEAIGFKGKSSKATRVQSELERFQQARDYGLLTAESLADLNEEFSRHYFTGASSKEDLHRVYVRVAKRVRARLTVNTEQFFASVLMVWPLYHFAQAQF